MAMPEGRDGRVHRGGDGTGAMSTVPVILVVRLLQAHRGELDGRRGSQVFLALIFPFPQCPAVQRMMMILPVRERPSAELWKIVTCHRMVATMSTFRIIAPRPEGTRCMPVFMAS